MSRIKGGSGPWPEAYAAGLEQVQEALQNLVGPQEAAAPDAPQAAVDPDTSLESWIGHASDPKAQAIAAAIASALEARLTAGGAAAGAGAQGVKGKAGAAKAKAKAQKTKSKAKAKKAKAKAKAEKAKGKKGRKAKVHTVRSGDTLWDIAQANGVSLSALIAANPQIKNPDLIHPGDKVTVPGKGAKRPAPSRPAPGRPAPGRPTPSPGGGSVAPASGPNTQGISNLGRRQMATLLKRAEANSGGKRPQGWCLKEVQDILEGGGYGKIGGPGGFPRLPYARNFAEHLNQGQRWKQLGLKKLNIDNPYDAPPGAIVVVRAGTPGTSHPTAGDIAIAAGNGRFLNDGEMGYGGPGNFPPGNNHVLGVYVPA